jgi:hypothetical protein
MPPLIKTSNFVMLHHKCCCDRFASQPDEHRRLGGHLPFEALLALGSRNNGHFNANIAIRKKSNMHYAMQSM